MSQDEPVRLGMTLEGEMLKRFLAVKRKFGLEANTDVVRMLITNYYDQLPVKREPLEHVNLTDQSVMLKDWTLDPAHGRLVEVWFREGKAWCEYDDSDNCKHVNFALDLPEVKEILRKKGWKPK